jgi:hypothetical protein
MIALPQTLPVNKTYLVLMAALGLLLLGIGLFGATQKAEKCELLNAAFTQKLKPLQNGSQACASR